MAYWFSYLVAGGAYGTLCAAHSAHSLLPLSKVNHGENCFKTNRNCCNGVAFAGSPRFPGAGRQGCIGHWHVAIPVQSAPRHRAHHRKNLCDAFWLSAHFHLQRRRQDGVLFVHRGTYRGERAGQGGGPGRWQKGPDGAFARPDVFLRITKVETIDDKNFVLHMNRAEYDFAELFAFALIPAHLEEPVVKGLATPADYNKNTLYNRTPTSAGLWNGPYKLAQIQSGAFLVFEPNPHWWGQKPYFKRITIKTIDNTATLEANLRSGDLDFISGVLGLSIDQALAMSKEPALQQKFNFEFPMLLVYEQIHMNRNHPALADKRVRQALLLGIDRETLVKQLVEGKFPVAHTWVNPQEPGYDPNVMKYPFDASKAKALLDQAGFKPGADGIRVNAAGQRLSLEYMTTAGNKLRELIQQVLQNQWKKIGVEVVIKNTPARTYFGETLKKQQFSALAQLAWTSNPEAPPSDTLSTSGIPTAANNYAGVNYTHFSNPAMDKLIDEVKRELDPAKRKPLWAEMQKIYAEELPVLPLFFRTDVYVVPKWLTGVLRPGQKPSAYFNQESWGVR
ncbi:MAG: peptide ABC transporter [Alphaproteobacteria bacterium PA3]|nr:MAG: peptide ABC transporter [Alphaproteobacteria bacterium PA3]